MHTVKQFMKILVLLLEDGQVLITIKDKVEWCFVVVDCYLRTNFERSESFKVIHIVVVMNQLESKGVSCKAKSNSSGVKLELSAPSILGIVSPLVVSPAWVDSQEPGLNLDIMKQVASQAVNLAFVVHHYSMTN